jgi:hypothetical protein
MEIKKIELTEIKATENMVLTNGVAYSSVGGSVYLGVNDSPENWHEITVEEYEEILKIQEAEV